MVLIRPSVQPDNKARQDVSIVWLLRTKSFDVLAFFLGRLLLRLILDRWPNTRELHQFKQGLHHSIAPVPPLLRGFCAVPAAQPALTRSMLLAWLLADRSYQGVMREGLGSEAPPGDHLRVWTGQPVSFLHFEKTAGTTVLGSLCQQFHPVQIDPDPYRSMAPHVLSAFPSHAAARLDRHQLVHGHYDFPALRRLGRARFIFTMLREPRSRILSLYYFWRATDPALLGAPGDNLNVRFAHEHDLLAFLNARDPLIANYIDNVYVRRLIGCYATSAEPDPLHEQPARSLDLALQALDTLDLVGITESTQASLAVLTVRLDGEPAGRAVILNDAESNRQNRPGDYRLIERQPMTVAIEAALDRLTVLDREIYAAASARLKKNLIHRQPVGTDEQDRESCKSGPGSDSASRRQPVDPSLPGRHDRSS